MFNAGHHTIGLPIADAVNCCSTSLSDRLLWQLYRYLSAYRW